MRPLDPVEQNARSEYLEHLYILDGRDNPTHPLHGFFTGLYWNRMQQLMLADREKLRGASLVRVGGGSLPRRGRG